MLVNNLFPGLLAEFNLLAQAAAAPEQITPGATIAGFLVLGIMGLRDRNRNPAIKGSIHAGIGIGCGAIFMLLWGAVIIGMIINYLSNTWQ